MAEAPTEATRFRRGAVPEGAVAEETAEADTVAEETAEADAAGTVDAEASAEAAR